MDYSEKIEKKINSKTKEIEEIQKEGKVLFQKRQEIESQLQMKTQDIIKLQHEINSLKELQEDAQN